MRVSASFVVLCLSAALAGCGAVGDDAAEPGKLASALGSCNWNNMGQVVWDPNQGEFYECVCNSQTERCAWNVWEPWNEEEDSWDTLASPGWALEDPYGSGSWGTPIHTWHDDGLARQYWVATTPGAKNYGVGSPTRLVNLTNGLCLGVSGGNLYNGAELVQWGCNNAPDQMWQMVYYNFDYNGNPVYKIYNQGYSTGWVLDADGGLGRNVHLWASNGNNNNQFWYSH